MSIGLSREHGINGRSSRRFYAVGEKPFMPRKPVTDSSDPTPRRPQGECGVWGCVPTC